VEGARGLIQGVFILELPVLVQTKCRTQLISEFSNKEAGYKFKFGVNRAEDVLSKIL
jgi:hypothetical protein